MNHEIDALLTEMLADLKEINRIAKSITKMQDEVITTIDELSSSL